ncbi:unnamed protein product [Musa acuminata subsp. malaccensis]|uniref:Auxin-responsive protein n=1 Tax=Musa acuminata subsp. malaccensis TaxID=214687 RepID=A0A804JCZ8_MUSAM|nr:PREDICTED: auxin-responsive protein IAA33-like [Musa acuminata subsp. malaccensis]CAG1845367.1 unnamed protein product [Musa acuminata subsp. malaccensis]
MVNGFELHHEAPKRRCGTGAAAQPSRAPTGKNNLTLSSLDDDVASAVVPRVTVFLEGRSICHLIRLDKHTSYASLAKALRRMFVDVDEGDGRREDGDEVLHLSDAMPGHIVAYEDMEDDLLLVGDLNWK